MMIFVSAVLLHTSVPRHSKQKKNETKGGGDTHIKRNKLSFFFFFHLLTTDSLTKKNLKITLNQCYILFQTDQKQQQRLQQNQQIGNNICCLLPLLEKKKQKHEVLHYGFFRCLSIFNNYNKTKNHKFSIKDRTHMGM